MSLLLVGVFAGVVGPVPAQAAAPGRIEPGVAVSGVTAYGDSWLGAMVAPVGYGDDLAFCVTAGGGVPMGTTPAGTATVDDPVLAAAMAAHRRDEDAATRAALSYLSHVRWETGSHGVGPQTHVARYRANSPATVTDRAAVILAEATAAAGPYAAATVAVAGSGTRTGDLHGLGVTGASGGWVPGLPFTVTLSGPAVFEATGTATVAGTTGPEPLSVAWTGTGTGVVSAAVTFRDVPRVTLTRLDGAGDVQTVLTYGHRPAGDSAERVAAPVTFEAVGQFQPVASTAVGARTVAAGEDLVDRVTVTAAAGDRWLSVDGRPVPVTFVGTAYATGPTPPAAPGAVPPGAHVVARATLTATGPGTYAAVAPGQGSGRFVTWVWEMSVAQQPEAWRPYLRGDWRDGFGVPDETASVRHRAQLTSRIVVRSDASGRPVGLADDVVVGGLPEDHPGFGGAAGFARDRPTITQSLWFFPPGLEVSDEHRGAATLLGQAELPAADGAFAAVGDGAFALPRSATGAGLPGTYVFTHAFGGDDRVEPFETSVTAADEQYVLVPRPLVVATVAVREDATVPGDRVLAHDVATVAGDVPVGATVAFELYRWRHGGGPVCVAPVWVSPALVLAGEGEVRSPTADVVAPALDLGFVAVVRAADGTVLSRGECGAREETIAADVTVVLAELAETGPGDVGRLALLAGGLLVAGGAAAWAHRRRPW